MGFSAEGPFLFQKKIKGAKIKAINDLNFLKIKCMVNLDRAPMPSEAEAQKAIDQLEEQKGETGEGELDSLEALMQDPSFNTIGQEEVASLPDAPSALENLSDRNLGQGLKIEETPAVDDLIELSPDDLEILDDEEPNEEGVIELDSADLIEEPEEIELDMKDMEDMEEVFERDWSKGEWQESQIFPEGKYREFIKSQGFSGLIEYGSMLDRGGHDKNEDMAVFNFADNSIAVGDGLGSSKESDKTATVFQQEMGKLKFEDFKGKSNKDIQNIVAAKFNQIREELDKTDGKITLAYTKVFEDAEGNKKLVAVSIGDSSIQLSSQSEGVRELGDSLNLWKLADLYWQENFMADPISYLKIIAKKTGENEERYTKAGEIINKIKGATELSGMTANFDYHKFVDYLLSENGLSDDEKESVLGVMRNINKKSVGAFNDTEIKSDQVKIIDLKKGESYNLEIASDGHTDNVSDEKRAAMMMGGLYGDPSYLAKVSSETEAELLRLKQGAMETDLTKYKPDDNTVVRVGIQG